MRSGQELARLLAGQGLRLLHLHPVRTGEIRRRHDAGLIGELEEALRVALERGGLRFLAIDSEYGKHLAADRVDLVRAPFDVARRARKCRAITAQGIEIHVICPDCVAR